MLKKIFTKEMATNAVVTLGVVLVALAINEKFIKPTMNAGASAPTPTPPLAPLPMEDEA
jgi:hypothetical protein